jgi:hypothetical protein
MDGRIFAEAAATNNGGEKDNTGVRSRMKNNKIIRFRFKLVLTYSKLNDDRKSNNPFFMFRFGLAEISIYLSI